MNYISRYGLLLIVAVVSTFQQCSRYRYLNKCGELEYQIDAAGDSLFVVKIASTSVIDEKTDKKATFSSLDCLTERIVDECCRRSSSVCLRKELLRYNSRNYVAGSNVLVDYLPDGSVFVTNMIPVRVLDSIIIATYE